MCTFNKDIAKVSEAFCDQFNYCSECPNECLERCLPHFIVENNLSSEDVFIQLSRLYFMKDNMNE